MIGGLFKSSSFAAIVAAGLLSGGVAAKAADLGGNCCADLEERVAELEATTARKGNRVVSLEVSGQVNRALVWHDDDNSTVEKFSSRDNDGRSGSRFRFRGGAKINADWSASFLIEIGVDNNEATASNSRADTNAGVLFRHTRVTISSRTYGTVHVGRTNTATEGIAEIALASAFTNNSAEEASQVAATVVTGLDGASRKNGVHYVSPTVAGFSASASWFHDTNANTQNDDGWAVALRYAGEYGAIRVAAGIGYTEQENGTTTDDPATMVSGSGSIMHVPTGLFLNGVAGVVEAEDSTVETTAWWIGGGIRRKWNSLGNTTLEVGYGQSDTDGQAANPYFWQAGISQNIDAAAMDVYLNYQYHDADTDDGDATTTEEASIVVLGARVKF